MKAEIEKWKDLEDEGEKKSMRSAICDGDSGNNV